MSNQRSGSVVFLLDRTLRQLRFSLQHHFNEQKINLSVDQWIILNESLNAGAVSHKVLADRAAKDPASVTRIVHGLVKLKFITRVSSEKDQRVSLLKVTAAGKKELQKSEIAVQAYRKAALKGITKEELVPVKSLLDKLFENTGGAL
ncbi:MAG TPA: MarR family transcriptional regulator [Bacteroidia bacterium]|nr:MarR family transcriptional regulator [Bacteroidia bacterium]